MQLWYVLKHMFITLLGTKIKISNFFYSFPFSANQKQLLMTAGHYLNCLTLVFPQMYCISSGSVIILCIWIMPIVGTEFQRRMTDSKSQVLIKFISSS